MSEKDNIKFNFSQYRRHSKSYRYLIRIGIYILILGVLLWLIQVKQQKKSRSAEDIYVPEIIQE